MYNHSKILALAFLILLPIGFLVSQIPQTENKIIQEEPAYFIISGWDYPDEYGQGIYRINLKQNISGSFFDLWNSPMFYYDSDKIFNLSVGGNIFIQVYVYFNRSNSGIPNILSQGLTKMRLSVDVIDEYSNSVFSSQDFTKDSSSQAGDPIWWLRFYVILDFDVLAGRIYTATLTYETYY